MKEIEKLLGGFSQNSLENLLEEQNLLAGNIYKLSYTQILSATESENPGHEFLSSAPPVSMALRALRGRNIVLGPQPCHYLLS